VGQGDFPTYYAAELKLHIANDATLFPTREHSRPGPILTPDGLEEHEIDHIIDSRACGHGFQYLVRWKLKTTNGFLDAYLKTARCWIIGMNLVVMVQALHDTFQFRLNFSQMV